MKLGTKINLVLATVTSKVLTAAFWVIANFEANNLKGKVFFVKALP